MLYEINTDYRRREIAWWHNVEYVLHIHRDIEIIYVAEGILNLTVTDKTFHLQAGQIIYIEPFEPHSFRSDEDNTSCIIEFSPTHAPAFWQQIQHHTTDNRIVDLPEPVITYLDYLLPPRSVLRTDGTERKDLSEAYMSLVVQVLTREFMTRCRFQYADHSYEDIYAEAFAYILKNIERKLTLTDVAHHIGVAPETLSRWFSQNSSMGFNEYVRYMRVCTAADYLQKGRSVSEAAMSAGFGSISNFNRMFKKVTSMTPMQYRNLPPEKQKSIWNGVVRF